MWCCLQHVVPDNMPSSRVREIPILREADQQSHQTFGRTASPANCPTVRREIPIQRDTGIGGRAFGDFFQRPDHGWGDPWKSHHGSRSAEVLEGEPFSRASGFRSRPGFPGFTSHIGNDFLGDRRSPVQQPFSRHSGDYSVRRGEDHSFPVQQPLSRHSGDYSARRGDDHSSSEPCYAESPVTMSQAPQQPVPAEESALAATEPNHVPPHDEPKHAVPVVVEPDVTDAAASMDETEARDTAADASLHVEEPPRRARSPSPAPPNMTSLEIIEQVLVEGAQLKEEVEVYVGGRKEKPYLRLEELLTRLMLKLDRIESEGRDDIRSARREAVHTIESILELLESRTSATAAKKDLPSTESSAVPENSSSDVSDSVSETCSVADGSVGGEQAKNNVDAAAVKEMVLRSEVKC